MTLSQTSNVNVVFGAMTIGQPGPSSVPVESTSHSLSDLPEIDTARYYGQGSSEEYLGSWAGSGEDSSWTPSSTPQWDEICLETSGLTGLSTCGRTLLRSLKALRAEKIGMWYPHGPDRTTPFEETLNEVDRLHKEGYFTRFVIGNYMAWEVAQICELCDRYGWIKPAVYQGVYNALHRSVEAKLFPCLRHYGMAFYSYNPLAGGYLTSRYHREQAANEVQRGSRFDPNSWQGKAYRARYWNDAFFDALDFVRPVAAKHAVTEGGVRCDG